jgi:hypothetical protein
MTATLAPASKMVKFPAPTDPVAVPEMACPTTLDSNSPRELLPKMPATPAPAKQPDSWSAPTKSVDVRTMAFQSKLVLQSRKGMVAMTAPAKPMVRWSAPLNPRPANAHTMAILWTLVQLFRMVVTLASVNHLEQLVAPITLVIVNTWAKPCNLGKLS